MHALILHHYPQSPFSEKIRLVLGFKGFTWKSVIIPAIMPKPDVVALTGGYRKTPFLQIGADIYCDSTLICEVLERLQPTPTLYPAQQVGMAQTLAQWADSTLFWAAMAYNLQPKGAAALFAGAPPDAVKAFGADRAAMAQGMTRLRPADATVAYQTYLQRLESMLQGHNYLLGSVPCVADFAAYHPLWYTRHCVPVLASILNATPAVLAWMGHMAAFGHGTMEKMSATEAIAASACSTGGVAELDTSFVDTHGIALGTQVSVAAESFGAEATAGALVAASASHITLRRHDSRAGTVHVHFPRVGYVLRQAA